MDLGYRCQGCGARITQQEFMENRDRVESRIEAPDTVEGFVTLYSTIIQCADCAKKEN